MSATGQLRLGVNIDHVATVRNARGGACTQELLLPLGRHRQTA